MNTNSTEFDEREEFDKLLPWYVTGKLDRKDQQWVEQYLAEHPEVQDHLEIIREEQTGTFAHYEKLTGPSAGFDDKLLRTIENEPRRILPVIRDLLAGIGDIFAAPSSAPFKWAGAVAAVVIVVQAVAIATLVTTRDGSEYFRARGPAGTHASGTYVLVKFSEDATAPEISKVLADLRMSIAGGPKGGGLFVIRVGPPGMSKIERDRKITELKKRKDLVAFVTIAK